MIAVAAFASLVILGALALTGYVIHLMVRENKDANERAALMSFQSAAQVRAIVTEAFDRMQTKSAAEAAEVAYARMQSNVAVKNLQDELARRNVSQPKPRKVKSLDGNEYLSDEIEVA